MKFDSARDEILSTMAAEGWANASDGNVDSNVGWFARVSNSANEMPEITQAFNLHDDEMVETLSGHFLLREDSNGFFYVTEYASEVELTAAYDELVAMYSDETAYSCSCADGSEYDIANCGQCYGSGEVNAYGEGI